MEVSRFAVVEFRAESVTLACIVSWRLCELSVKQACRLRWVWSLCKVPGRKAPGV